MYIYLHATDNLITYNKKNYLLRAQERLKLDLFRERTNFTLAPEYVLNIEPYEQFVRGTKWTGIWEIDILCDRQAMGPYWHAANDIFVAVSDIPARLLNRFENVRLLLQACDPELHRRDPTIKPEFDFIMAGSNGPPYHTARDAAFTEMMRNFKYYDYGKGVKPQEYVKRLCTAKVQFIRSMNSQIAEGELAQRFFECLAIGPVLTNDVPDLKYTNLEEGVDYFSYKTNAEMLDKMRTLIKNPEFAAKMAASGRKKALMYHTYENRLMTIYNIVKDYDNGPDSSTRNQ